jgi:hypothetical protein
MKATIRLAILALISIAKAQDFPPELIQLRMLVTSEKEIQSHFESVKLF